MKKPICSLAAKTAAVILSFVFAVLTAGCVFAGAFMYSERFYTKSPEQIEEEKYAGILCKTAAQISKCYGEKNTEELRNLSTSYFTVRDGEDRKSVV